MPPRCADGVDAGIFLEYFLSSKLNMGLEKGLSKERVYYKAERLHRFTKPEVGVPYQTINTLSVLRVFEHLGLTKVMGRPCAAGI